MSEVNPWRAAGLRVGFSRARGELGPGGILGLSILTVYIRMLGWLVVRRLLRGSMFS